MGKKPCSYYFLENSVYYLSKLTVPENLSGNLEFITNDAESFNALLLYVAILLPENIVRLGKIE